MSAWFEMLSGDRDRGRLRRGGGVEDDDVEGDENARRLVPGEVGPGRGRPLRDRLEVVGAGRAVEGIGGGLVLVLVLTGETLLDLLTGDTLLDRFTGRVSPPCLALMSL